MVRTYVTSVIIYDIVYVETTNVSITAVQCSFNHPFNHQVVIEWGLLAHSNGVILFRRPR